MKILHLVLKYEWYDMIESGEKPEEYRDITPYWDKRLNKEFDAICFHRAYTNTTQLFKLKQKIKGYGETKLGAPELIQVWILKLGDKIHAN